MAAIAPHSATNSRWPDDFWRSVKSELRRAFPSSVWTLMTSVMLIATIIFLHRFSSRFGIDAPRLAITGLNPHAGESGALGEEENEIIVPTVLDLKNSGMNIDGPLPAGISTNCSVV